MTKRKGITDKMKCSVAGCDTLRRAPGSKYCEKHYYRLRRTGSLELTIRAKPVIITTDGYRMIYAPDHPLRALTSANHILEHRIVMFDHCGLGPYFCHWCSKPITWEEMDIDHLDDDKRNNAFSNLEPSCPLCNRMRGLPKQIESQRRAAPQYEFNGIKLCAAEWARRLGISTQSFRWRIRHGWALDAACQTGRGKFGPRGQSA